MNNGPSYFEIQVDDIERAKNFYGSLLDWKFTRAEGLPVEYWRIETGGSRGGLLKRPMAVPKGPAGTNAFTCSMEVNNFDESAQKILDMHGQIAMEKFAIPGVCWQGYFLDTEGNTFGLFQPDADAN